MAAARAALVLAPADTVLGPELEGAEPEPVAAGAGLQLGGLTFFFFGGCFATEGLCPEGACAEPCFGDAGLDSTEEVWFCDVLP
ncbi:hypothetical protein SBA1_270004 [Candidatus Sulfotelmatobacter kueseliae]|uniref:Uncharacterized protein n=1 Tax=Candidatus Sulfotelmatobacter kueseliae TaxID=2042962 RepID=A0A2U3KHZ2_9BACT|nr:hypothetical protein SBA1_270004 [Candidatus Sulfotelmatobacter kueseliae]